MKRINSNKEEYRKKRAYVCKECNKYTYSPTHYCYTCWDKKNELAKWLIIKNADKKKGWL